MKIAKIIAYILSQLLRLWVTASAAAMMYIPMSALAFSERGYKAIGGEMFQADTLAECEEFIKCRGLLENEDVGDVRVALLSR